MTHRTTKAGVETTQDHLRIWTNSSRSLIRADKLSVCMAHYMSLMHRCVLHNFANFSSSMQSRHHSGVYSP